MYQTFYSTPWDLSLTLYTSLWISFLLLILFYFIIKYIPKRLFLYSWILYFIIFWAYIISFIHIPLTNDIKSELVYNLREDRENLYSEDFDSMNYEAIVLEINNLNTLEEKNKYIQSKLNLLAQNQYEQAIYFVEREAPNKWLFYNKDQFLNYKKQRISNIQNNLNYEEIDFNNTWNWSYLFELIKRENNYKEIGWSLQYFKISKNTLLEIRDDTAL